MYYVTFKFQKTQKYVWIALNHPEKLINPDL